MQPDRERRWADLLRRANRGDREAYTRFLTEIAPVLLRLIVARSRGRSQDTEDILQNTLVAIHEKRHTWHQDEPVSRWIYAIARYKAADAWRRGLRKPADAFDGAALADNDAPDPTASQDLDRLLSDLDATSAAIVRGIRLQGLSAEETGRRFGLSPGAVRVKLHRALARMSRRAAEPPLPRGSKTGGPRK